MTYTRILLALVLTTACASGGTDGDAGGTELDSGVATLDGLARADYYDPDHGVKLPAQAQPMPWSRKKPVDYVLEGESWQPSR